MMRPDRSRPTPTKLIDWIINCALDGLSWNDHLEIPRDLIVLIRERLGGPKSEYEEGSRTHELKSSAAMHAGQLVAMGRKPSIRALARAMRVAPSTVQRWFKPGELEREIEVYRHWFDKDGEFITIIDMKALRSKERAQHPSVVAEPQREKRRRRSPRKSA
jgi:DNA-binding transcriptional regulator YhcF (GntR family)